jgi:Protein of unknown function (DUF3071)
MQDLRLIGVHEDGQHLLLADGEGGRFRVPLDEPLRAAARRDRAHLGQLQIEIDGGLRPRDVQSMIRAGASAEEVAERAGWSVEKVRRYEGPILAEREHVAGLGRTVRLRGRGGSQGPDAPTLASRVAQRLAGRGVDPAVAEWDSARSEGGEWTLVMTFPAGGRERQARWRFDVAARTVSAADDEARWLSEDDTSGTGSPIPAPHLVSTPVRATTFYDVEAEGGLHASARRKTSSTPGDAASEEPLDLMTAMRERAVARGRRSGGKRKGAASRTPVDESPREDALPLEEITFDPETMPEPPAARGTHPLDHESQPESGPKSGSRPESNAGSDRDTPSPTEADEADPVPDPQQAADPQQGSRPKPSPKPSPMPATPDSVGDDVLPASDHADAADSADSADPADAVGPADARVTEADDRAIDPAAEAGPAQNRPAPGKKKGGRTSVPSWDDVMFGARPRD